MMKRMVGILMLLVIFLTACQSDTKVTETTEATEATNAIQEETDSNKEVTLVEEVVEEIALPYPAETIKIAVEIYDPTDVEFLAMKEYFEYLAESFNVEFIYSEAITSAEHELQFIENAAVAGAKALLVYYNVSGVEAIARAIDYGMYVWGMANDEAVYDMFKDDPFYLGSTHYGDGEFVGGYEIGKYAIDNGATKIVYSSGGANFGVEMFVKRRAGFMTAVEEAQGKGIEIEVIDVAGFPGESFFADQASALTKEIDAVVASFNGLDFWAQPIASAGKSDSVILATIGSLNDAYNEALANGSVDFLASKNIQSFGFAIPMIVNAVDGNADVLKRDGLATNLAQSFWLIPDAETSQQISDIKNNVKTYSAEEMLSLVKGYNKEADARVLEELVNSDTVEEIIMRRTANE